MFDILFSVTCVTMRGRGDVAQWLEQSAHNRLVAGSSPAIPTIYNFYSSGPLDKRAYKKYAYV